MARFARQIAGQGYICAAPSSYHEFTGPEPLQYNAEDTDKGNAWKISKVSQVDMICICTLYWFIFEFLYGILFFFKDIVADSVAIETGRL